MMAGNPMSLKASLSEGWRLWFGSSDGFYTFAAQIGAQRGVLDHDLLALANKKASLLKLS